MKDIGKRIVALFVVLLSIGLLFRYGGAALSFASGLVPTAPGESKVASGTVYTATPGKGACGVKFGATPYEVQATLGFPDTAVDYAVTATWRYDVKSDGDYSLAVAFDSTTKYEEGRSWKEWVVNGIQCFRPSVMGSVRTGVSDKAAVVATLGEPNTIVYWDDDRDRITRVLFIYERRDLAVTFDAKTGLVDGFIVVKE